MNIGEIDLSGMSISLFPQIQAAMNQRNWGQMKFSEMKFSAPIRLRAGKTMPVRIGRATTVVLIMMALAGAYGAVRVMQGPD